MGISGEWVNICMCNRVYALSVSESDDSDVSKSDSDADTRDEDSSEALPSLSTSSSWNGRVDDC